MVSSETERYPSDWKIDRIDAVFEIQQGKQVSKKNRVGENQHPFLRTKNVFWNRLDLTELDQMHFTEAEESHLALRPDDLLVCEGGSIGRAALWRSEVRDCYYKIQSLDLTRYRQGVAVPTLNRNTFRSIQTALPPREEQEHIADMLDSVETKSHTAARKKTALQELCRTLLHELMTGKKRVAAIDLCQPESRERTSAWKV